MDRTLYTQFRGSWCDNCDIAAKTKLCPDCGRPGWPADITVQPLDEDEVQRQDLIRKFDAGQRPEHRRGAP